MYEKGMAARLLLSMPRDSLGYWSEAECSEPTERAYTELIDRLLHLEFDVLDRKRVPRRLRLSPEAKSEWITAHDQWEDRRFNAHGSMKPVLSKLRGHIARFALIHHVVSCAAHEEDDRFDIGIDSLRNGIILAEWFAYETERVYLILSATEEADETRRLVEWIRGHGGTTTVRRLQNSNSKKYQSSDDARRPWNL